MTLEFLAPDAAVAGERSAPVARSPMERAARAAGARFELRDGWNVAVAYGSPEEEADRCRAGAGWADVSHLGKLELQAARGELAAIAGAPLELGRLTRAGDATWLPLTPERALVLCPPAALPALRERLEEAAAAASAPASVVEVTTVLAALTLVGPLAREVFARFTAIDLRPQSTPVGAVRPGSIARQPGIVVREDDERFLFLFGWAVARYMWTVVADAGERLGAAPVGVDALAPVAEEASPSA
jgi:heterotetrameric sarcosine oxidase gamma subunit